MRGHKPQPAQIINFKNDKMKIGKDKIKARAKHEPKINSAKLTCPQRLPLEAQREWRRIVKLYRELAEPIISDLDVNALEIYCESLVTFRKAMVKVRESSEVYKADQGPKMNPWLRVANDAALMMKKYGELLLLDPVSRARVGLAKAKHEEDPNAGMFGD